MAYAAGVAVDIDGLCTGIGRAPTGVATA